MMPDDGLPPTWFTMLERIKPLRPRGVEARVFGARNINVPGYFEQVPFFLLRKPRWFTVCKN